MRIVDAHCDALTKLALNERLDFDREQEELDVCFPRLRQAGVKVQLFAMYVSESIHNPGFDHILHMIDVFYRKIGRHPQMQIIRTSEDWLKVEASSKIGAVLTLEGLDALGGNLAYIRLLHELGVRAIGLTWNYANWAADGVMEPRNGGFTRKGRAMLKELESLGIIVDVSHLSVAAFWELTNLYPKPFIASHSNAQAHCAHPRNLSDDQIKAIITCKGMMGLTFVPYFVESGKEHVPISALLNHIDHVCALGGEKHIGFGSDFDGIEQWMVNLRHTGDYANIREALSKSYTETQVEAFLYGNWRRFMVANLPRCKNPDQSNFDMDTI
ncbi:dipeptidase [Paenibacillus ferrarius]|uniref:dipeptidase n=1 Tax=Paenibacillus ferrarius TaxID=1469647 RepID=UPI003D2CBBEA